MPDYSCIRYLSSKKTVDDRALNKDVLERLRQELGELAQRAEPLRVIELGCGIGNMPARLVEWGVLKRAQYTLVDVDAESLAHARDWLVQWAASGGRRCELLDRGLEISGTDHEPLELTVTFLQAELSSLLEDADHAAAHDLLIANALLDLVALSSLLPPLLELLVPKGLYWLTINYDADTIFEPEHALDAELMAEYHRTMDERVRYGRPAGHSKTGRRLFGQLAALGAAPLCAGASDWVVYGADGKYFADEAYFLRCILKTVEQALESIPAVDRTALAEWIATREAQLDRGELVYIAHQLDFVGMRAGAVRG